jgi:geranylgeranyl reductase family protein
MDADTIVVGAGPAGAATAYYLARGKRRVLLLDRQRFPRDKSCGDGLTRATVALLDEMGLSIRLEGSQKIRGLRVFMRGRGSRDFEYPDNLAPPNHGLVVPRLDLDHALCQHAVAHGAVLREGARVNRLLYEDGRVSGVVLTTDDGAEETLRADAVVAADGAASRLARQASLVTTPPDELGFAIRGYFAGLPGLSELLEIYTPLLDPTDRFLLPSYGWIFAVNSTTANIGVGLFQRCPGVNVRELFERFLDTLRRGDARFARAIPCGPLKGAPLRFDFSPDRCSADGLLLVGDAAGLISPFTGEGISYALESGKLAADAIERALRARSRSEPLDLSDYSRMLSARRAGYFETGRQAARRYLLVWHVLESTFHNERPIFSLCRRAALFPEGIGESHVGAMLDDVEPLLGRPSMRLRADLMSVGDLLTETVREDWPFLAHPSIINHGGSGTPFRPALLLLLSAYTGTPADAETVLAAAAIELGYLASLAQISVMAESDDPGAENTRAANWGNLFAVIVADFLLSKAHELSARAGPRVSAVIAEALARSTEGRLRELRHARNLELAEAEQLDIIAWKTGTLFELPCRLGGVLGRLPPANVEALARYGRHLGVAYQLTDDAMIIEGRSPSLGQAGVTDLDDGLYSVPIMAAVRQHGAARGPLCRILEQQTLSTRDVEEIRKLTRSAGGVDRALELARIASDRAKVELNANDDGPPIVMLRQLADYAVERSAAGADVDLHSKGQQ